MNGFGGFAILIVLILHIISSYPMYRLAEKANYEYSILAFIPVLNMILVLNVGGMSGWWLLIFLIPFINILFGLYASYRFFESFESGIGVFAIIIITGLLGAVIPFVSLIGTIAIWWLALSDNDYIGTLYGSYGSIA